MIGGDDRLAGTGNAVTTAWTHESQFQQVATITDPLSHTTTFGYSAAGRLTTVTDALTQQWAVSLSSAGQVQSVTDPLSHARAFEYAFGDLTAAVDGAGRRVTFHTDVAGRRVAVTDALGHHTLVAYTPLNLVSTITDAKGGQTAAGDGRGGAWRHRLGVTRHPGPSCVGRLDARLDVS